MKKFTLDNIQIEVDTKATTELYNQQNSFVCDCRDCSNYVSKLDSIINEFDGLDAKLGIDLTRDIGIGSDELMPHDYDNHILYLIPYYVIGHIEFVNTKSVKDKYKLSDRITLDFLHGGYNDLFNIKQNMFCMWIELTLPIIESELIQ